MRAMKTTKHSPMASSSSSSTPSTTQMELQRRITTLLGKIDRMYVEIDEIDGPKVLRERDSLNEDLKHPDDFNKRVMQVLDKMEKDQNELEKKLNDIKEEHKDMMERDKAIQEQLEMASVSIPAAVLARIKPVFVGLIDSERRAPCVGVGCFVGTRLILTAYHNLANQNTYEFRTPEDVKPMVKYGGALLEYNAKDDWALLQSDKVAPDFLEVCEVTEEHSTRKVVTLAFAIGSTDVGFMEASTIAVDPLEQYCVEIQPSYVTKVTKSVLRLNTAGISGSAVVFTCDGKIMGMHVNKYNNVKALPPPSPDDDPQTSGKKISSSSAAAAAASAQPNTKRQKHKGTSPENIEEFARPVSDDGTTYEAKVLIVFTLMSRIDYWNKRLTGESTSRQTE